MFAPTSTTTSPGRVRFASSATWRGQVACHQDESGVRSGGRSNPRRATVVRATAREARPPPPSRREEEGQRWHCWRPHAITTVVNRASSSLRRAALRFVLGRGRDAARVGVCRLSVGDVRMRHAVACGAERSTTSDAGPPRRCSSPRAIARCDVRTRRRRRSTAEERKRVERRPTRPPRPEAPRQPPTCRARAARGRRRGR